MSTFTTPRADFFGKDQLTFFIGQVEDVNDPKLSGRVRVRCVGWHPKEKVGKDSLATEDLPWAHVAMPTTHSQLGGAGGKHGLLPGSWVIGFFFDGEEAQQPIIINSFNFVAKATKDNLKSKPKGEDGKLDKSDPTFSQVFVPKNHPNIALTSVDSKMDPSKVVPTSDAQTDCGTNNSVASVRRMEEPLSTSDKGNPESQIYDIVLGDGLCGSIASAKDDIQKLLGERMPSQFARYIYNDVVWSAIDGNYLDMNGIMKSIAMQICNLLKQPAQASKAKEEELNRMLKAEVCSIMDRDGYITMLADETSTVEADMFHGIFGTSFIDMLCQMIQAILQQMNNDGQGGSGENFTGNVGATSKTKINDWGSECIADNLLDVVNTLTTIAIKNSKEKAKSESKEDNSALSAIGGILATLIGGMDFPLTQKYSKYTEIFNRAGDMSQDISTKSLGCIAFRSYNTQTGSGGANSLDEYKNKGFGGKKGKGSGTAYPTVCEDATEQKVNPTIPNTRPISTGIVGNPTNTQNGSNGGGDGTSTQPNNQTSTIPTKIIPSGNNGAVIAIPLPSQLPICGANYINGTPNTTIIIDPGKNYFYTNPIIPENAFPIVTIPGYNGTPTPVVDPDSGELVAVVTSCSSYKSNQPNPPVTVIPSDSSIGIRTDDPDYDIILAGVFIKNMGFEYCDPIIEVWDRDRGSPNGSVYPLIQDGHFVDIQVINTGSGFRRIPDLKILDNGRKCNSDGGYGAKLYPIMQVVPRPNAKPQLPPVEVIYCPGKDQINSININRGLN